MGKYVELLDMGVRIGVAPPADASAADGLARDPGRCASGGRPCCAPTVAAPAADGLARAPGGRARSRRPRSCPQRLRPWRRYMVRKMVEPLARDDLANPAEALAHARRRW